MILTFGALMMAVTVAIHAIGSAYWLGILGIRLRRHSHSQESLHLFRGIMSTAVILLLLHVIEVHLWALIYVFLPGQAGLNNYAEAVYFSMVTLTTLGYGDITLNVKWQLLSGMEAMVGIMVFGLSTAILFAVIQQSWKVKQSAAKPKDHDTDRSRS